MLILRQSKNIAFWLAAFFSPTLYLFLLALADRSGFRAWPEKWVAALFAALFVLVPIFGLSICCALVWRSASTKPRRIGWLIFTFVAMAFQCGILFLIIVALISAAISLPQ